MYEGTWESVGTHRVPGWYDDAKLGIFIHWGLYSVPGWAPRVPDIQQLLIEDGPKRMLRESPYAEWYRNTMQIKGSPTHEYHTRVYGQDYPYDNFVRTFNDASSRADLDGIADLCQTAGARYVVLTTKHHDGFALWPSDVPHPVKGEYHAQRDLVGDLTEAVRARRMRMGLYYSGGYDWPYNDAVLTTAADAVLAAPQDPPYVEYVTAHYRELIDRYRPSVLWNDISWPRDPRLPELFAYYYNTVEDGVINDRWKEPGLARSTISDAVVRGVGAAVQALWQFIPERRKHLTFGTPKHCDFRTPEYEALRTVTTRQVGTGPGRRALVRCQPPRAARGHHFRDGPHPVLLRRRIEERQPPPRSGAAARRDHPRTAAGAAARTGGMVGHQRGGDLRQPALGGDRVGRGGRDAPALHQERRGCLRADHGDAALEAAHHAGHRRLPPAAGAPGRGRHATRLVGRGRR